jgi:hypothetical protein
MGEVVGTEEAVVAEGEAEASMVEVDTLVAIVAGTPEVSMVDTMEGTEVGTMVVFVEDTGAEAFTRIIGDFGDFL